MDEENFPRAEEFRPERWLRKDSTDRVDNFGSIPFGYGIRSCIGRRIAELEMHLALTQVCDVVSVSVQTRVLLWGSNGVYFPLTAPSEVPH